MSSVDGRPRAIRRSTSRTSSPIDSIRGIKNAQAASSAVVCHIHVLGNVPAMAIQNQNIETLVCTNCQAANRIPSQRLGDSPVCGKCKKELLPNHPVDLTDATFQRFISRTSLPVLVDFWAPWCGPCKMMAPAFEQATQLLSPGVILAKVNTELAPHVASRFGIQSIPTLTLILAGKEKARQSGAMNAQQLVNWARANIG